MHTFIHKSISKINLNTFHVLLKHWLALKNHRALDTVSVGKNFGYKGKQHHKHTASETQSHNKWSHQVQRKIMEYFHFRSDQALIPAWPPLTSVYLALRGNEVLSVTTESVKNEKEYSMPFICLFLDVRLCLKMGAENMVMVKLLQIGAKDLTV